MLLNMDDFQNIYKYFLDLKYPSYSLITVSFFHYRLFTSNFQIRLRAMSDKETLFECEYDIDLSINTLELCSGEFSG